MVDPCRQPRITARYDADNPQSGRGNSAQSWRIICAEFGSKMAETVAVEVLEESVCRRTLMLKRVEIDVDCKARIIPFVCVHSSLLGQPNVVVCTYAGSFDCCLRTCKTRASALQIVSVSLHLRLPS